MRLATLLRDVLTSLVKRPVTQLYPQEKHLPPARLRGRLHWRAHRCSACALCVKDCPANALELTVLNKADKHFEMTYHLDRCIFCGHCVYSCRFGGLALIPDEWELATADKAEFTITARREPALASATGNEKP